MKLVRARKEKQETVVDEVRRIRREISARFGNDVDRLCRYLQRRQRRHKDRLVNPETFSNYRGQKGHATIEKRSKGKGTKDR
jgi:hypothetical protein